MPLTADHFSEELFCELNYKMQLDASRYGLMQGYSMETRFSIYPSFVLQQKSQRMLDDGGILNEDLSMGSPAYYS